MSQAGRVILESGGGAGNVDTLRGNTGGKVGPDGTGNIDIVFPTLASLTQPGAGKVTGSAITNTLTVNAWIQATAATTDGVTVVPLYTLAVPLNKAVTINALVSAKSSDFTRAVSGIVLVGAINNGGVVTIIGTVGVSRLVSPNGNVVQLNAAIVGTNLEITVVGEAGVTYAWSALIYYVTT